MSRADLSLAVIGVLTLTASAAHATTATSLSSFETIEEPKQYCTSSSCKSDSFVNITGPDATIRFYLRYNGSTWRVTEIYVLTSKMEGDHFVDAVALQVLLPVGGAPVDGAVQDLLQKVAPDRKRAGVNPSDTGPFEVVLGPQPSAYRWKIERARGYPPRQP